jgi:hypothetical protein
VNRIFFYAEFVQTMCLLSLERKAPTIPYAPTCCIVNDVTTTDLSRIIIE